MRILVIEDEHKIANSIKRGFEQETWATDVAYDGEEGYDLASTEDYDVIVLDLMLPKMPGIEICKKLRKAGNHTPILMLTARGAVGDRVEGLDSGADDYLVKPFAFEELLARVRALVRRPKETQSSELRVNDLVLNTNTFEVKKNGKNIELSRKEFAILEYLMRNSGKVVSKENIIAHVWNYEADILPNTVEVFIGYLRDKLGNDLIHTVRGFGYRI
ncbi:MAG: Two component transcriptional regulator, winged helix family [Candidatus Woesebacteria bacterium GW2011_GWA1_40_43]|uniref:Two component transcriptional regulator, winged helix family n=1 Tax=Candidatus Woesebacteria bacterium GW2011_GWA1_40_43 TaxID=1618553 RepID=A0A0G0VKI5_9BACT|nr:MAG: Two component transcriptional regulator, winged helix family [Candidatus Woesebacteria bacterium GW2011_GWD2_40_19]KKR56698.1 MAG: Two component transcriptional regulator, winged helix family [Candidatus Woesebacteria bacterium GW2011_GWC2_40_30]KKR63272.1 MAG: Two component transcriptional regulator, winged helix family [Candidatus Woesebacteria bacterium GW2011_GWA1_40_43]HAU65598.1 DNA-binding response regulator [Candidatus Woesebacteria bacterium]HCC09040.1 DNA-binding response regu